MALNNNVRRFVWAASFVFITVSGFAQDTLTLGNGSTCIVVPPGTTSVIVPVHIRSVRVTSVGELAYLKSGSLLNGGREVMRGANRMTAADALATVLSTQAQGQRGDANGDGSLTPSDVFSLVSG